MLKGNCEALKTYLFLALCGRWFSRRKKAYIDVIGEALNGFHPTLNFTTETEPKKKLNWYAYWALNPLFRSRNRVFKAKEAHQFSTFPSQLYQRILIHSGNPLIYGLPHFLDGFQ